MKKIYIILTHTGTMLSRVIKFYTRANFSHVSISLDSNLTQMYSFGKIYPYNPLIGGFVRKYPTIDTFNHFPNTKTKIYEMEVTDKQYEIISLKINKIIKYKNSFKFNIIELLAVNLNVKFNRVNSFYCISFVKYLFNKAKISNNLPNIVKPCNFVKIDDVKCIYEGLLRKYVCMPYLLIGDTLFN